MIQSAQRGIKRNHKEDSAVLSNLYTSSHSEGLDFKSSTDDQLY
jgi:hypothetical protein